MFATNIDKWQYIHFLCLSHHVRIFAVRLTVPYFSQNNDSTGQVDLHASAWSQSTIKWMRRPFFVLMLSSSTEWLCSSRRSVRSRQEKLYLTCDVLPQEELIVSFFQFYMRQQQNTEIIISSEPSNWFKWNLCQQTVDLSCLAIIFHGV